MSGSGWRPHIESALALNLTTLLRQGVVKPGVCRRGWWQWTDSDGEQVASVGYNAEVQDTHGSLTLNYTQPDRDTNKRMAVECVIRLSATPLHFGGLRWWMHCPYTKRRARKLYKFGSVQQFCHRTAIRPLPTYASQRVSGMDRINQQRWALRQKMGDKFSDLFDELFKPKWMRWQTFEKFAARDNELAERDNVYLYRFLGQFMRKQVG